MDIVWVVPGPPDLDVRTFECGKCGQTHIETVAADWLVGELRPPK
jgi:hypothetical protein